jgi:hypothetical protein
MNRKAELVSPAAQAIPILVETPHKERADPAPFHSLGKHYSHKLEPTPI